MKVLSFHPTDYESIKKFEEKSASLIAEGWEPFSTTQSATSIGSCSSHVVTVIFIMPKED